MAYHSEKTDAGQELVIDGFENGIGVSPHKGIGNIQGADIATETNEVMVSFARIQQSQTLITGAGFQPFTTNLLVATAGTPPGRFPVAGNWVTVSGSSITGLSNGTYFVYSVVGNAVQLSTQYDPLGAHQLSGLGATGSASYSTAFNLGQAVQSATEFYTDSNHVLQNRYYIIDSNGRLWVYDTALVSLWNWFLPFTGVITTPALGIGFLNGTVFIFGSDVIFTVSSVQLDAGAGVFAFATAMTGIPGSTNLHYAFTGHQGSLYYTDGNFIGSIFPNTSLDPDLPSPIPNVQSYASWTGSGETGTITAVFSGSVPATQTYGATARIPAFFFASNGGTTPTALIPGTKYYIDYTIGLSTPGKFNVYDTATTDQVMTTSGFAGGETTATLTTVWTYPSGAYGTTFSDGEERTVNYIFGSNSISWTGVLTGTSTNVLSIVGGVPLNITTGATGTQYFNTFFTQSSDGTETFTFNQTRVTLPVFETAISLAEIGNQIIIGTKGNTLYPWNQIDPTPSGLISLPENNAVSLLTVNNMCYIFAGSRGNIYITNGSTASLVVTVPDYCTGLIEPYFVWGGTMYLRGRVFFSIQDQTSTHTGNCGGIWSFVPTQNFFIGQDTGLSLRMDNRPADGTFNGMSTVLIPSQNQFARSPQYWDARVSSITSPLYSINFTASQPASNSAAIIQTDLVPTGTLLNKKTFEQVEFKLAAPTDSANVETVSIGYRNNLTDAFVSLGTAITETPMGFISGYFPVNFEKTQWLQFQITLTPTDASTTSFVRLTEVRAR